MILLRGINDDLDSTVQAGMRPAAIVGKEPVTLQEVIEEVLGDGNSFHGTLGEAGRLPGARRRGTVRTGHA